MVESSNRKTEFVLENATPVKFKMAISIMIIVGFTGFSSARITFPLDEECFQ